MESHQNHRKRCRKEAENSSSSAAAAALLPEDILNSILLRLPVKCLLRFKSVCKQWRALISDPHFVKSQLKHTTMMNPYRRMCAVIRLMPENSVCISSLDLVSSSDIKVVLSTKIPRPFGGPRLTLGSSNGLLMVFVSYPYEAFLWNPCTGECWYIPGTPRLFEDYLSGRPSWSILNGYIAGFGYDSSVDDYKAVIIFHDKNETSYLRVFIFTCRTGFWTELSNYHHDHGFPYLIPFSFPGITLNNGAPYWIVQLDNNVNNGQGDDELVIVYFDWSEERLKEIPLPDDSTLIGIDFFALDMVDLCGYICVFDHSRSSHFDIWVMKEHGVKDSWTKLFVFPKSNPHDFLTPLGFTENGDVLLLINKNRLIIYDCNTGKEVLLFSVERQNPFILTLCMESLVSPDGAEGSWKLKQCTKVRERE